MIFRREKKEEPHKDDFVLANGIYLKTPEMPGGSIVSSCFLRSLIAFLLVTGSIGGFLSALDISYNYVIVMIAYLVLSLYFSFLYALPTFVYRDIGYVLFFGVFVGAIYLFRIHANSGLYAVVNVVLSRAQTFFELSGVREYEKEIDNDYLTVAIAAIFIGMVLIILLNIWLYSRMSLIWAVFLTFPLLIVPLYMKLTPDAFYVLLLAIGYTAVLVFKANGHYLAFAWDKPFRIRTAKRDAGLYYTQDAGVFRQVLLSLGGLLVCVMLAAQLFVAPGTFDARFSNDRLRDQTTDVLGNFVLLGFSGMYNRYSSVGGMSGGMLGGISNVRPDYMTDLIVSYVPYSNQAVYLKAFTGGRYGDNEWLDLYLSHTDVAEDQQTFEEESLRREADALKNDTGEYAARGIMRISNVGADGSYLYYPYYTEFSDYTIYNNHAKFSSSQGLRLSDVAEYTYYPKIVWEDSLGDVRPSEMDVSEVDDAFLEVPDCNAGTIMDACEEIGLTEEMTENEIVDAVTQYFADNIPYTLNPGATPDGEDFVEYFLTKNRKGYCAHFASAGTLIFRQMGIPARYVEGYAFSLETVLSSEINESETAENFYTGYNALGDSPVMQVEVTDAMAHAWVEIYVDGFGWKVVEVTPGSNETTDEDSFWDAFTSAVSEIGADGTGGMSRVFGDINLSGMVWIMYVAAGLFATYICYRFVCIGVRKGKRYRACHQKDPVEALVAQYANLCDMIRVCDPEFDRCRSHREQLVYIRERYPESFDLEECCELLEAASFGKKGSGQIVAGEDRLPLRRLRRRVWKQARFFTKIRLCKR